MCLELVSFEKKNYKHSLMPKYLSKNCIGS